MHNPRILLTLLLSIIFLSGSAGAIEEIKQENIYSFDISAPEGLVLSGMTIDGLTPFGSIQTSTANSTFIFNQYGDIYTLSVNATRKYDAKWIFDISLIYPNSTTAQTQLTTINPWTSNYDIHVQYYALEWDSPIDIDIYTGLLPLSASFPSINGADPLSEDLGYTNLAFSEISGTSTQPMTVTLYASNQEEFEDQANGDLSSALSDAVGDLFSWTWDSILSFVELIPGIGPYLALTLEMSAMTIDSVIFYFDLFFIEFAETTFISIEAIIWSYAISGFKRGGFWGFLTKAATAHGVILEFGFNFVIGSISAFFRILEGIAAIVSALKPV